MSNILGLPDWKVIDRQADQHDMMIAAEYTKPPEFCAKCGVEGAKLLKHGVQEQTFMDTPMHGKRVGIKVQRQRYRCADCKGTFQQLLPDMDEKRTMTKRLLVYIQERSLERTFMEVSQDVGLNEKTVRNIFTDYVTTLDAAYHPSTPKWLGIDELFLVRKPRCMLTNVKEKTIVDILENRDKPSVLKWLSRMEGPKQIEVVTMDMWRPYRDAAQSLLPQAQVVVDKFHVVRMANLCLDRVRKRLREGMDTKTKRQLMRDRHTILRRKSGLNSFDHAIMQVWTANLPELLNAYNAKEGFYAIYDTGKDKRQAIEMYDEWLKGLDATTKTAFGELIRAVGNWKPEIFAFFEHRATNAYTEAVNGLTKVVNRMGRGYSFEAIRAKMLFGHAKHVSKPKFGGGKAWNPSSAKEDFGVDILDLLATVEHMEVGVDYTPESE